MEPVAGRLRLRRRPGILADDVVAEAFAQAGRMISAIRDLRAWLFRTAFRIAAGELARVHDEPLDGHESSAPADDLDLELRDMASRLNVAQRRAFVLRELLGLSTAETAKLVGSSEVAVRVHLHAARRRLAEMMREEIGMNDLARRLRERAAPDLWPAIEERLGRRSDARRCESGDRGGSRAPPSRACADRRRVRLGRRLAVARTRIVAPHRVPGGHDRALRGAQRAVGRPSPRAAAWVSGSAPGGSRLWRVDATTGRSRPLPNTTAGPLDSPRSGRGSRGWGRTAASWTNICEGPAVLKLEIRARARAWRGSGCRRPCTGSRPGSVPCG